MRLETSRLLIRDWHPESDAADAIAIYGDPQVTQWIGDKSLDTTVEAVQARLQRYRDRAAAFPGLGCWAIVQPGHQTVIGTVLLMPLPDRHHHPSGKIEIGWHLRPASWGYGYATEAAHAILKTGFTTLDLPVIYAVTLPDNDRSINVMHRLQMSDLGMSEDYYGGYRLRLFCRPRDESSAPA